jgi:hypothetical protein
MKYENLTTKNFQSIPNEVEVVDGIFMIKRKEEEAYSLSSNINTSIYVSRKFNDITSKLQNIRIIPALNMLLLNKTIVQFLPYLSEQSIIMKVSGFPKSDDADISYDFNIIDMGANLNVTNNSFNIYIWDANLGKYSEVCYNISDITSMILDLKGHTISINSVQYSIPDKVIDEADNAIYINLVTTKSNLFSWLNISLKSILSYIEKRNGFLLADSAELITNEMFDGSTIVTFAPTPKDLYQLKNISMEVNSETVLPRVFIRYGAQFKSLEKEEWFESFPQRDLEKLDKLAYIYPLSTFEFSTEYYAVKEPNVEEKTITKRYSGKIQLKIIIPKIDDKTSVFVSNITLKVDDKAIFE